jgi:hypothetical protein
LASTQRDRLRARRYELALHIRGGAYEFLKPRVFVRLVRLSARERVGRRSYRILDESELRASRTSDTAFVFGSGRSLTELGSDDWDEIARHNTISLREFPRQNWVRVDYHLTSEVDFVDEYALRIRENPLYATTIFVVQSGFRAERANEMIGRSLLTPGARIFRFKRSSRWSYAPPSETPRVLVHGYNSIFDATNLAYALGFTSIVLAGADYYDKGYFWLPEGETRSYEAAGITAESLFTGHDAIVEMMGRWHEVLAKKGVELSVLNPRSLLARELPVFKLASQSRAAEPRERT